MLEVKRTAPIILDEINTALAELQQAKHTIEKATDTLMRAGAFVSWATSENRRLVRERDAACGESLSAPQF